MKYNNHWSRDERFIYLGEFEYNNQIVDLYVLKHPTAKYFCMGCRMSDDFSDYYSIPLYEDDVAWFEVGHRYAYVPEIIKRLKHRGLMKEWGFEPPIPSV